MRPECTEGKISEGHCSQCNVPICPDCSSGGRCLECAEVFTILNTREIHHWPNRCLLIEDETPDLHKRDHK